MCAHLKPIKEAQWPGTLQSIFSPPDKEELNTISRRR